MSENIPGATSDDYFDIDKYKKAAGVAVRASKQKMREEGRQTRKNIGTTGSEQRTTSAQQQRFSEQDEERDYQQSQRAYRF
jgi:hypothetical protein